MGRVGGVLVWRGVGVEVSVWGEWEEWSVSVEGSGSGGECEGRVGGVLVWRGVGVEVSVWGEWEEC